MNKSELEIRYKAKVRTWHIKFERLSNDVEEIQTELVGLVQRIDKIALENMQVMVELRKLQEEQTEMSFDNIVLGKQ